MNTIQIGVVGYGYWGPNLVRNYMETPGAKVLTVSDLETERLKLVKIRYPTIETTTRYEEVIANKSIDAIVIATPVSTHFEMALQALRAGKHVLVEKPLAQTAEQAAQLIKEADQRGLALMVDHTFVYTGAVRKIRELVASDELGEIYYYDSVRINLGLFQHDVNVLWDLAVHDLAIMDYVLNAFPVAVSATGISNVPGQPENIAYMTLYFESNLIAHIHVNWLAPVKVRRTLVGGSRKMVVYDDLEPSEKIKVYNKGITVNQNPDNLLRMRVDYRIGDMWAPQLDRTEALRAEADHFIHCINNKECPLTDGQAGLRVVRILQAASQSIAERGRPVELGAGATGE